MIGTFIHLDFKMGNTETTLRCDKCPGDYVCIKCYAYYCSHHITQHACFDNLNYCKLCPTELVRQCKKCNFYFCDNHITLHDPCITHCKKCIHALSYCNKCNINITHTMLRDCLSDFIINLTLYRPLYLT